MTLPNLGPRFRRWWAGSPFAGMGVDTILPEAAFRAGYLAARRDALAAEERSRARLARTEAAIAEQVAAGGLAGQREMTAEESVAAAQAAIEAVERVGRVA